MLYRDLGQHQKAIRAIEKAYADIPSHVGRLQPIFSVSNLLYRNSEKASSIYFKWLHRVCQDTSHPVAAELCSQHFVDALNAYIEKLTLKGKSALYWYYHERIQLIVSGGRFYRYLAVSYVFIFDQKKTKV